MARRPDPRTGARALLRALAARGRACAAHRGGNVALLFSLLSVPMLMLTGAAIDYGLATRLETKLQAATDATSLLLCQTPMNTSETALNALAKTTMDGQMGAVDLVVDPLVITSNPRQITLTAHKVSTTFFGKVTGTTRLNPGAAARCATPLPKTFEIALVLDNTGSMSASSSGQSKMQAAKTAANNFIDYVKTDPSFSSATRISIVPFAAAVAVDPVAYRNASLIDTGGQSDFHWTNVLSPGSMNFRSRLDIFDALKASYSGWGWAGCLESLPYPLNVQDGAPTGGNKNSYYVPMFAPDEPGDGTTSYAYYNPGNGYKYSFNSYIDDSNGTGSCPNLSNGTSFANAQGRACKYVQPRDPSPTSSNYVGLPNGPNFMCTTKPLQRLTTDTSTLKALVNSMAPLGSTNIHEGFMWGWRTISPSSVFKDGAAYTPSGNTDPNAINKIIILMTDGENTWSTSNNNPNGALYGPLGYLVNTNGTTPYARANQDVTDATSGRNALDALTATACTNAKKNNISVYTIGFSIPTDPIDTQGLNLLLRCASSPSQFFVANDSTALINAFKQIAASIGTLRLTQ